MLHEHERAICCLPDCSMQRTVVGRCKTHSKELKINSPDEFDRIKALSSEEQEHEYYQTKHELPLPHWTYEGHEEELIQVCDQHSVHHAKVGFRIAPPLDEEIENGYPIHSTEHPSIDEDCGDGA
jgi:hypothetical protein